MATKRPIQVILRKNELIVERSSDGEVLARCFIGDDAMVERIADILSSKRQTKEAQEVRQAAMNARKRKQK